jgi:hypothetical protein
MSLSKPSAGISVELAIPAPNVRMLRMAKAANPNRRTFIVVGVEIEK